MKIKTITCHKVYNYGAILQEYALIAYLKSIGCDAETINYRPYYLSNHFNLLVVANPKYEKNFIIKMAYLLAKLPQRLLALQRKKSFDAFEEKYIPSTKVTYLTNEALKSNIPEADAYICGSDQIWNSFFQNGKDPAFYLDFVPEKKMKISYAASFAIDEVKEELKEFVKGKVSRINHISVRETSGVYILNKLGVKNVVQVVDPVFLIEKYFWISNFVSQIKEKYIFVYDCDSNIQIRKIVKEAAKKFGLKIFTVNNNIKYADKSFYYKGPETFLSLINNADFVISNSFHAVAFSLIFQKKFLVVDRHEQINTRMRDLMNFLELSHLHLGFNEYKSLEEVSIDYKKVSEILNIKILESKNFLNSAIG